MKYVMYLIQLFYMQCYLYMYVGSRFNCGLFCIVNHETVIINVLTIHTILTCQDSRFSGESPDFSPSLLPCAVFPLREAKSLDFYAPAIKWQGGIKCLLCPRHSVLLPHQSLSSQLLLHPCMDLSCTTSREVHVGR